MTEEEEAVLKPPYTVPEVYCGTPVPEEIKAEWRTWKAADWRRYQHYGRGELYPPDMRFTVSPPKAMCARHKQLWLEYRNRMFDPVTGNRYPGGHGSPFIVIGDVDDTRRRRRAEWDEEASADMKLSERICLSGTSPQCGPDPHKDGPGAQAMRAALPAQRAEAVSSQPDGAET